MGKNKHNKHNSDKKNGQNVRISDGAREFAKLDLKKFKKKEGEYYDSKKELKRAYYSRLVDLLPEAIEFVVFDGYKEKTNDEVAEIKNGTMPFILLPYYATNHCLQTRSVAILGTQFLLYKVPDCLA